MGRGRKADDSLKKKNKKIKGLDGWKEMKTTRQTLSPENRAQNLHRASWPKYRIKKNFPYGNGARSSPFSVPMFVRNVGEGVELQVRPRPGKDFRCDVVSILFCELTTELFRLARKSIHNRR